MTAMRMDESSPALCSNARVSWVWAIVGVLVVANAPLMLCMPLAADAVLYDLQAKTALTGGILYRDIVEPNLPGIVWCHMAIRSLLGWSEAALKWADLAVVAGILTLLVRVIRRERASQVGLAGFAFVAIGFYCSTPEWVHCQRDIWLMLPALAAFALRLRCIDSTERVSPDSDKRRREGEAPAEPQPGETSVLETIIAPATVARAAPSNKKRRSLDAARREPRPPSLKTRSELSSWSGSGLAIVEGLLWGCAFWIKPYVSVPAACTVGMSLILQRRAGQSWTFLGAQVAGVLVGGVLAGAAGSAWLIATGVWPHFWEQMLEWNPVYFANGRSRWTVMQYLALSRDLAPWCLVHLAAAPVAVAVVWRAFREPRLCASTAERDRDGKSSLDLNSRGSALLSALYLGWMLQAHFLQHPFHYCHTPTVILAAALLATRWPREMAARRMANLAFTGAMAIAVFIAPCFDLARLAWWPDCITRGAEPDVKCALHHRNLPNWVELRPVVEFLKSQDLKDGELTAYNVFLVHLYPEVGVRPSTRYVFLDVLMQVFHAHSEAIHESLAESPQRFVVCSLLENGMPASDIAADGPGVHESLPAAFPAEHAAEFPYCLPLVFRSGQYVVYRVDRPIGELNTKPRPLAVK